MTDIAATPAEPDGAPRIASLDILRGLAILGILFMNVGDMGGSLHAFMAGDVRHIGWSGFDQLAWWLREVLASGTARALLEMLFGAGMVILTDRAAGSGVDEWHVLFGYWRRNAILFLFGLAHVFVLLWPGDILHTYGLAAMIAVLFRGLPPRWLLAIGLSFAVLQLASGGFAPIVGTAMADSAARIAAEDVARRAATGDAVTWVRAAWDFTLDLQRRGLELIFVWEAAATMLVGAALYRWGVLQGARSRRFYVWTTLAAYGFGLGCRAAAASATMRFDGTMSIAWPMGDFARLATTLGHIGLVHLLLATAIGGRVLRPFAAAGRTALSVYVAQTLVCLWLLYPPFMLGLYGQQGWASLMLTALIVDAVLLWGANRWVRTFAIGPVEWAWRSIVERRRLPFRRWPGFRRVDAA